MWGAPVSEKDLSDVFMKFCQGQIPALPWCDSGLSPESTIIISDLIQINSLGFLTINSQPAVDGALSSDTTYGWGPKNGFVYQKAYIEFFVAPKELNELFERMKDFPALTYHAVNKSVYLLIGTYMNRVI